MSPRPSQIATATILADRLNVRSGPGTGYGVVASAKKGEKYTVTGQSGSCAWLKIASGGKALGWVSGNKAFVKLNGACSGIPAAGASSTGGAAAPAAGKSKQGCALLTQQAQDRCEAERKAQRRLAVVMVDSGGRTGQGVRRSGQLYCYLHG